MAQRRKHVHFIIGLVISGAAIYLSLRKVDFQALAAALQSIHYVFLIPAIVAQLLCFILKGTGWRFLLLPAKKSIRLSSATTVLVIGLMVNNLFPAKMGELARAYLMGEREGLPKTLCLSTVFVEHLLDILVLTAFLLILLPYVALPPWLRTTGMLIGALALALIILLFFMARHEGKFLGWIAKGISRLPKKAGAKIQSIVTHALEGTRVVNGRYILFAASSLVFMWISAFTVAYLVLAACGIFLPFYAAIMVVVFVAFGKIIPSSPGAIGTYHYLVILVLMSFQVEKEAALGAGIILHALSFLLETSIGIAALLAGNLTFRKVARGLEGT